MQKNKTVKILFFSTLFPCLIFGFPLPSFAQSPKKELLLVPKPAWVKAEPLTLTPREQKIEAREGIIRLLSDQQVRIVDRTTERYFHHAQKIVSQPGVEQASQLQLEFDPTYQRLMIHNIRILRAGQIINALKPHEIKLVQQESELEERLFNGTLVALVILNDVRVGDVIEYDYSVNGENPILGGKFADVSYLVESEPVSRLRYRLLWPSARLLKHSVRGLELKPQVTNLGNMTEYVWQRLDVPAPDLSYDLATEASDEYPILHLSEFQSWQEVVGWALPLYQSGAVSSQLRQQIETWRQLSPDPEKQLLAALRFVQDEIRYLGIEMGPHSHLPHSPAVVLARRYGDCKDKALLLCTALNALGIPAQPTLVNTELYEQVESLPPSPYSFDHVIVCAQLNEQTYWFDATTSLQRGTLAHHVNPNFGRGLLIQNATTNLVEIPVSTSNKPLKTVREVFRIGENNTATLEVVTVLRGTKANDMRAYLAAHSIKDLAQEHLRAYSDADRSFTAEGKPQINDDEVKNELTITEHFLVGRFWKDSKRLLVADRITQELPWIKLNTSNVRPDKRIRLIFPLDVEHVIEIHGAALPERQGKVETDALTLQFRHSQLGDIAQLSYRLRTLQPYINTSDANRLNEAIEQMEDVTKLSLSATGRFTHSFNQQIQVFGLFGLLLMPLLAWFAVKWLQFRQSQRQRESSAPPAEAPYLPPGATPETALPASEMRSTLPFILCLCGANFPPMNWPQVTMIYDGKRLCVLQMCCEKCQQPRDLYFVLPSRVITSDNLTADEERA